MSNYVFVFHAPTGRTVTAEDEARWGAWFEQIGGSIADPGNRVGQSQVVGNGSHGDETLGGYIVVSAASLAAASELAGGCPILSQGGRVEVGEIVAS